MNPMKAKRWAAGALAIGCLSACGGHANSHAVAPSPSPSTALMPIQSPRPGSVRAVVLAYIDTQEHGTARDGYAYLSTRCQGKMPFKRFRHFWPAEARSMVDGGGVKGVAVSRWSPGRVGIIYVLPQTPFNNGAQPWKRESGTWKDDDCQPLPPR
jgi:hypothetical protein